MAKFLIGMMLGVFFGFTLSAILMASKRADQAMPRAPKTNSDKSDD